jgi:RimJ/RimL family protein N-acetyltransferase
MMGAMSPELEKYAWPLHTPRLSVRPAGADDVDATWEFRRLPEVTEWMTSATQDKEEYRARFLDPERLSKTLIVEHDGTVIGDLMVAIGDAWAQAEVQERGRRVQAELGWCLHPEYCGRGLATEAVEGLLRLCFVDLGLHRVKAACFADNIASWRLMERVGMRRETHGVADSLHRSSGWLDGLEYAMLADEWRARQG